jgi:hypothetical protein
MKLFIILLLVIVSCKKESPGPGPTPTAKPTASITPPNPSPTFYHFNPEAPRPIPTPFPKGSGECTGGQGKSCGGGEGNCICHMAISRAIHGFDINLDQVKSLAGGEPMKTFTGGGSENIPVTCHTAIYIKDKDPKWLTEYLDIQLTGKVGIFGREIFPGYLSLTAANIIVIRKYAENNGHQELNKKASEWLRAYWAVLSLMSTQDPVRTYKAWHYDQASGVDTFDIENAGNVGSYGLNPPANRAYVNDGTSGVASQYIMLGLALDHPTRRYDWSLDQAAGTTLCGITKSLHYPFSLNGKINLQAVTPPASDFGLSAQERAILKNFILSNGTQGLDTVLSYLAPYKLNCHLTIIRTDRGINAWFGNETDKTGLCSRAKGGTFVAGTISGSTSIALSRATAHFYPEAATVWKEGTNLCEESAQRPKKCIEMIGVNQIYKVYWQDNGHISKK